MGSTSQIITDVNGDGKDDSIVVFGKTGDIYVALSTGTNLGAYSNWLSGFGDITAVIAETYQIYLPMVRK